MAFWDQGATSIYLFNYDCHRQMGKANDYVPEETQNLKEIGDPMIIAHKNKRYVVAIDMLHRTPADGGTRQLPDVLAKAGDKKTFTFWIGDELTAVRRDDGLEKTDIRISLKGYDHSSGAVHVEFNEKPLDVEKAKFTRGLLVFDNPTWTRRGQNELSLSFLKAVRPVKIEGIEFNVSYV
jgi:hypothetical protein